MLIIGKPVWYPFDTKNYWMTSGKVKSEWQTQHFVYTNHAINCKIIEKKTCVFEKTKKPLRKQFSKYLIQQNNFANIQFNIYKNLQLRIKNVFVTLFSFNIFGNNLFLCTEFWLITIQILFFMLNYVYGNRV